MGVRKEVTVQHGFSREEIGEAVKATLLLLWGYEEPSPGTFKSDIRWTWSESGKWFTVDITREGIIKIASESKLRTQLVDLTDSNRENIKEFLNALKRTFSRTGLAKSKPEAYASFISDESTHIRSSTPGEIVTRFLLFGFLIMIIMLILAGGVALVFVVALLFLVAFLLAP
jgi:hypothetical protein